MRLPRIALTMGDPAGIGPEIAVRLARAVSAGKTSPAEVVIYGAPDIIEEAVRSGKVLVNVTQCPAGTVDMGLYANGKALERAGVVGGADATTESTLATLFFLLGKSEDPAWIRRMMGRNLKGEITLP